MYGCTCCCIYADKYNDLCKQIQNHLPILTTGVISSQPGEPTGAPAPFFGADDAYDHMIMRKRVIGEKKLESKTQMM